MTITPPSPEANELAHKLAKAGNDECWENGYECFYPIIQSAFDARDAAKDAEIKRLRPDLNELKVEDVPLDHDSHDSEQWMMGYIAGQKAMKLKAIKALAASGPLELPQDVITLVIAARRVMDIGIQGEEFTDLDKALEAFAARVRYEDEDERIKAEYNRLQRASVRRSPYNPNSNTVE